MHTSSTKRKNSGPNVPEMVRYRTVAAAEMSPKLWPRRVVPRIRVRATLVPSAAVAVDVVKRIGASLAGTVRVTAAGEPRVAPPDRLERVKVKTWAFSGTYIEGEKKRPDK